MFYLVACCNAIQLHTKCNSIGTIIISVKLQIRRTRELPVLYMAETFNEMQVLRKIFE